MNTYTICVYTFTRGYGHHIRTIPSHTQLHRYLYPQLVFQSYPSLNTSTSLLTVCLPISFLVFPDVILPSDSGLPLLSTPQSMSHSAQSCFFDNFYHVFFII